MRRLIKTRRGACVVLLSSVADQYLWDEVVHQGGFDLLTRPFRKEQVLSTLMFAYAHCRTPWPKTVG
jgi:FixJ family two-component response regulator